MNAVFKVALMFISV